MGIIGTYIFKIVEVAKLEKRHKDFSLFLNIYFPNEENCTE